MNEPNTDKNPVFHNNFSDIFENFQEKKAPKINNTKNESITSVKRNQTKIMDSDKNQMIEYPGLFAIDFGTSNSTVTLYDPKTFEHQNDLPKEQKDALKRKLVDWFKLSDTWSVMQINPDEWQKFIAAISKKLEVNSNDISEYLEEHDILKILLEMETCLNKCGIKFRRTIRKQLYEIYSEVLRIPPLRSRRFFPVELDIVGKQAEISSELEIISLNTPIEIIMGERVKQNRVQAISDNNQTIESFTNISGKFHHSPKRYFGQEKEFQVTLNEQEKSENITGNDLVKAAYNHLIELTKLYHQKNSGAFAEGDLDKTTAVVTYPTVASPLVRRELENMIKSLGIADVQIAYDEAVSVAIFFLWREFGGNLKFGIESFKTRCYRYGDIWLQNVLIIDIGGGTTDIALIELSLKEIPLSEIFEAGENLGYGGRYYVLTPKVLGSSGHLQLGGELITLRIFLWLKVAIAECLLTAVQEGKLECDQLYEKIFEIDERFLEDGKFQKGSLVKFLDKENIQLELDPIFKDALDTAEKILPTKWKKHRERMQTFYKLWDYAESAKLKLSEEPTGSLVEFVLSQREICLLLDSINIEYLEDNLNDFQVTLNQKQFEKLSKSVIQEALNIAKGLIENRLEEHPIHQKIDWLILSGKTSKINQVSQQVYNFFGQSKYFVWNQERITFLPEYTKIATSAGACYAETLLRKGFINPKNSKGVLEDGIYQLDIDVQNLSYYLPCTFKLNVQGEYTVTLFDVGQKLSQLSFQDSLAKARTIWRGLQLSTSVYRQDFKNQKTLSNWGNFNAKPIVDLLKINNFETQIKAQFEINQKLQFRLFLCRGNPHYAIDCNLPSINITAAIEENSAFSKLNSNFQWAPMARENKAPPKDGDIAVNVAEAYAVDAPWAYTVIFEVKKDGDQYDHQEIFYYENEKKQVIGSISKPLPSFPRSNKHSFYLFQTNRQTNEQYWILIGELSKPDNKSGLPCDYCATLDEAGKLIVHLGEIPPYRTSTDPECLLKEGWVYTTELELQKDELEEKRNPFSGQH